MFEWGEKMAGLAPLTNKAKESSVINKTITLEITNIKEFKNLIEETRDCLKKIEDFKFEYEHKI